MGLSWVRVGVPPGFPLHVSSFPVGFPRVSLQGFSWISLGLFIPVNMAYFQVSLLFYLVGLFTPIFMACSWFPSGLPWVSLRVSLA